MALHSNLSNLAGPPDRYSPAVRADDPQRRAFSGVIKFRLAHSAGRSYVVPDVLIGVGGTRYFLPSFFGPPLILFNVSPDRHELGFSFDTGSPYATELARIVVTVRSTDRIKTYDDGAQLYHCTFEGPRQITRVASGLCKSLADGDFALRVFHHTTPDAARKILASRTLWSSRWNLAGTSELGNVAYVYFTCLPRISGERDLRRIAMASEGSINFQTTSDRVREEVLRLPVYRGDTKLRTSAIPLYVPSALIAPLHLRFHPMVAGSAAYFEVVAPEIVRVGVRPAAQLSIVRDEVVAAARDLKKFDYLVLGDASTLQGLAAPFEEEDTREVCYLEQLIGTDLFEFWQAHQNTDVISGRTFEAISVEPT